MKTKNYGIEKPSVHWQDQNPGKSVAELVAEALDNIDAALLAAGVPVPAQSAAPEAEATSEPAPDADGEQK